jgi:outer membrane protein TolC
MQKRLSLAQLRFERGDADLEEVIEMASAIARKQIEILQAKVDCWEQYLKLVSGTSQPLSELL